MKLTTEATTKRHLLGQGKWLKRCCSYLKQKREEEHEGRIWYFISLTLFFAVVFFLFFTPFLRITVKGHAQGEGSIQLDYKYSDTENPTFTIRAMEAGTINMTESIGTMLFNDVPGITNVVRLNLTDLDQMTLDSIEVSMLGIPLKTYQPEDIQNEIYTYSGMNLNIEDGSLVIERTQETSYFVLKRCQYMSVMSWIIFAAILLLVSMVLAAEITIWVPKVSYWIGEVNIITGAVSFFILSELITQNYWYITLQNRLVNVLVLYILYKAAHMILCRRGISITICNIFVTVFGCTNYFLTLFRNKPLMPGDLSAVSTAEEVASGYRYTITMWMIVAIIAILLEMLLFWKVGGKEKKYRKVRYFLVNIPVVALMVVILLNNQTFTSMKTDYWNSSIVNLYRVQGAAASYLRYQQTMKITKPDGYSVSKVQEIMDSIEEENAAETMSQTTTEAVQPQNIIMIMNESFSDLSVLGDQLGDTTLPYFRSLTDNTIYGNMYVSVRGGGTCNTEFETLTGNSLSFLPANVYPYQNYIKRATSSLAQYFSDLTYSATAIHIQNPTNWNRKFVYPRIGFDTFYSINDYDDLETLRGYPTDSYDFEKVIEQYEANEGTNQFIFNVTMQNHGGYTAFKDVTDTVDLSQYGDYSTAELYLSLTSLTDEAFEDLINYYSNVEEPTMVIMYGDHQPSLGTDVDDWLMEGTGEDTGLNHMNKYITPFVIWTNYDIEGQYIDKISANYMSTLILKTGNFELPDYNQLIWKVFQEYPVLTQEGIIDSEGNFYQDLSEIEDTTLLDEYSYLQYNNLFDKDRIDECFELQ